MQYGQNGENGENVVKIVVTAFRLDHVFASEVMKDCMDVLEPLSPLANARAL